MGLVVAIICEIDFNIIPTLSSHNLYYVKLIILAFSLHSYPLKLDRLVIPHRKLLIKNLTACIII